MKSKPAFRLFVITTVLMTVNTYAMGQCDPTVPPCDLCVPPNSKNLCNPSIVTSLNNTSHTITINNPAVLPTAGTYNVVISYINDWTGECEPLITCSSATISSSGSSVIIDLGSCATLPADFHTIHMKYINILSTSGGFNYFFHFYNGACTLPLGNANNSVYKRKLSSFPFTSYQPARGNNLRKQVYR